MFHLFLHITCTYWSVVPHHHHHHIVLVARISLTLSRHSSLSDKFTYLGSSVESTEKDIETRLTKAWTAINRLSIIWKSDLTDKMKRSFFQAAVTSILLYGCTTWTLTKRLEKKLDGNYTRILRAILNKSWQQHPTRHQLYGHLPPITKTIQVRRTRHAGHCWRSRDELIRDVLLWIPTHGRTKAGRPAQTYIQQLCEDTGCCPEDLPRAMNVVPNRLLLLSFLLSLVVVVILLVTLPIIQNCMILFLLLLRQQWLNNRADQFLSFVRQPV